MDKEIFAPHYLSLRATALPQQDLRQYYCLIFERNSRLHKTLCFGKNSKWKEVRVKGDCSADDASLARMWAITGVSIIFKSLIDFRQELEDASLVVLLMNWETEAYPLHALLPSGRFIPNRVRGLMEFFGREVCFNVTQ